jgi:antitoxin component YwqK of YwqJK toxin-antitoxin module
MIKHFYFCFAFVFFQVVCYSQQIGTFKFQEKKYLVYPFRINEGTEIPVLGFKIPDGEYVAFHDYTFKEKKLSFKKNKKHVLTDTAKVTAVFIIKNNIPDGKATFYQYGEPKDNGKLKKHPESMDEGVFANGLKQGGWKTIEFENKKDYVDASETVTNYNKGVKEGYEYIYNDKHELDKKQKWHIDELCDTVFNYLNGKLYTEYDVCPRNEINYKISVYKKALKLLNINNLDNIKSYYKEYLYPSSKVVYNLKYNNGVILPFDSLGEQYTSTLCGEHYYFKYVTIKHPTINEDVVCYFSKNDIDTSITLIKFKNEEEYYRKEERIDYKYKTHRFSKRQTVISKEYDFAESYKNIDSLDKNSVLPVLIEKTTDIYKETDFSKKGYEWEQKPTTKRVYLIPKYGYAYNTNQYDTLIQIDTLKRALYLISTNTESSVFKKQNTIRSVSPHTDVQEGLKLNPFLEKDYLINVSIRLFEQPSKLNYINDVDDFIKEPFSETNISYALSYKDTLLNGIYCISRFSEPKKPLSYVTYIDSYMTGVGNRIGNYKNGKEDGLFQELNLNSSLKRIPADFKTYFFNHPHLFNSYVEQEYQQGLRHGKQTFYQCIDTTSRYGKKSRRKDFTTFKEHEVTFVNDTIDGIFKSFYPNGKLETELFFNRGRVNGDYKEYNEQGNQSGVMHFENGALHGECVQYFENNTYSKSPSFYANFNHNALKDSAIFYNHFSKLPSMAIYVRNDTMLAKKMYYPDGKLKEAVLFNKKLFKIYLKIIL